MRQEPVKRVKIVPQDVLKACGEPLDKVIEIKEWVNPTTEPLRKEEESLCDHCVNVLTCVTFRRLSVASFGCALTKNGQLFMDGVIVGVMVTNCQNWGKKNEKKEN